MAIDFQEDTDDGYVGRTIKNASADVTIAIASNFDTAGEKLTKSSALKQGNVFIPIQLANIRTGELLMKSVDEISSTILSLNKPSITLNIAGNGMYTLRNTYLSTQKLTDFFIYTLIKELIEKLSTNVTISMIRTGGQSGIDEAGAKAGVKNNIPTLVLAPKGWRYRDMWHQEIINEKQFKKRFEINEQKA